MKDELFNEIIIAKKQNETARGRSEREEKANYKKKNGKIRTKK